jgi:hypothetical protein
MKTNTDTPGDKPAKDTGNAAATPLQVWFTVTKHAAIIGEAHHAKGKRMQLPKAIAEEAVSQGLGTIDGVAG